MTPFCAPCVKYIYGSARISTNRSVVPINARRRLYHVAICSADYIYANINYATNLKKNNRSVSIFLANDGSIS